MSAPRTTPAPAGEVEPRVPMGRRGQLAATAILLLVIGLPGLLTVLGAGGDRLVDNRAPTPVPDLGGTALLRRETYTSLGQAFQDRLAGRNQAIDLDARIDQSLFQGDDPLVEGGRAGWLFLTEAGLECDGPGLVESAEALLDALGRAAPDARIALAVVPEKSAVYPDRLAADDTARARCAPAAMEHLARRTARDPEVVDVFAPLRSARSDPPAGLDAPDELYLRLDTHWTSRGAGVAAATVLDALAPGLWDGARVEVLGPVRPVGDLTRLLGRPAAETSWDLAPVRPGITIEVTGEVPVPGASRAESDGESGSGLLEGRTVVLQDSFGEALWAHLAPHLEDATYVSWDQLDPARLREVLAGADTVIAESVARQLGAVADRVA